MREDKNKIAELEFMVDGRDHEIAELKKRLIHLRGALQLVDMLWFDASSMDAACSCCDANLHDNCKGIHAQLNRDPCAINEAHHALIADDKIARGE